jgi:hypothetical protein
MATPLKTTMASLPLEILELIADRVEAAHRPSLFAFSLASKACYNAAAFLIFQNISIMIETPEGLQRDAGRLFETLLRTDAARHVHSITVRGAFRLDTKKTDTSSDTGSRSRPWKPEIAEILDEEEYMHYSGENNAGCRYVVYDERVIEESSAEDMAWAPFLDVLQATVGLRDLIYECRNQLPPSLLRTLHKHPSCRLHHLTFRFRTLLWGVPYPYEMELATSPSLHRVNVVYTDQDSDADFDYNADAVMELAGLAPNLKEVTILKIHSPLASSQRSERRPPWQGLPGYSREMVGSLTSLSILYPELDTLQKWAKHTDFTKLQHLRIGTGFRETSLGVSSEEMEWIARNISLPSLKTLFIDLDRRAANVNHAIRFFQSLEPLEELSINGPMEARMLKVVLTHHGPTLKKLSMVPDESRTNMRDRNTEDRVTQIQALCPVLENLAIPVYHEKSSASETAVYKCFSKMASLRSLFLILDCAPWRIDQDPTYDPHFEGEDDQVISSIHYCVVKRGHLKDHFINSAVDEGLARSIWMKITQDKIGKRLERLKLWTKGTFRTGPVEYGMIDVFTKSTARSWLIEGSLRDDGEVTVKELMQRAREEESLFVPAAEHRDPNATGAVKFASQVLKTFESIWPPKPDSRDWRDDWASFPLQE